MSFDLQLPTVCDHRIYRERTVLESDRRTILVSKPIAAISNMELWASDDQVGKSDYLVVVDSTKATPTVKASSVWVMPDTVDATGKIAYADTASLTVWLEDGTKVVLTPVVTRVYVLQPTTIGAIHPGQYVKASSRSIYLLPDSKGSTGVVASVDIGASTVTLASGVVITVTASTRIMAIASTGVTALKAGQNVIVGGASIGSQEANPYRMVQFKYKWKGDDYFEVVYNTLKGYCPKCTGLGNLDDISWDVRGQLAQAKNEKLLSQNLEKFTVTELGSNPFHLFVGTSLRSLIGQRVFDFDYLTSRITQEVHTTLAKLKDMQSQYVRTGRPMTTGEQLQSIRNVSVTRDTNDPTILRVSVDVTAMSGQPLNYIQYLKTAR